MARPRRSESGFALLLVFLMAAVLAIALYTEIPRVAFQTQRQKEQMLMERGEQFKLGIRRFMQANSRLPANLDELEKLNNRHFLRHRYKDPMTGKDEWRLIHSTGGVLTDSKLAKPGEKKDEKNPNAGTFVADMPGLGSMPTNGQGANIATRRRPSEGAGADFSQIGGATSPSSGIPGAPPVPGSPGAPYPGMPGASTNPQPGGAPSAGGGGFVGGGAGLGSQPNNPAGGQPLYPGQTPGGMPGAAPPTGLGFPGSAPGQPNQAVSMINSILTSPRPGGLAGIQTAAAGMGGTGIAGVASSVDEDALMVYADQTNYSLWEFVYDGKFQPPPDPRQGNGGTPVNQIGNMAGSSPPGSPIGSPAGSSFGGSPPGGSSFGAGQPTTSFGQSPSSTQPGQTGQPAQGGISIGGGQPGGPNSQSTNLNLRPGRR